MFTQHAWIYAFDYFFKNQLYDYLYKVVQDLTNIPDWQSGRTLNPNNYSLVRYNARDQDPDSESSGYLFVDEPGIIRLDSTIFNQNLGDYNFPIVEPVIIIDAEMIASATTKNFRMLNYVINIDFDKVYEPKEGLILANSIVNQWDYPINPDETPDHTWFIVGQEFKMWEVFKDYTPDVTFDASLQDSTRLLPFLDWDAFCQEFGIYCVLITKPTLKQINASAGKSQFVRYQVDITFLFVINGHIIFYGDCYRCV